jgi:dCTP deaminase
MLAHADALRPGSSLMPLYRGSIRGYESVYQPLNGHLLATHRLSDEWNIRNGVYPDVPGTHRHHRDLDRRNNNPWNIERVPAGEHIRLHNATTFGPGFNEDAARQALARAGTIRGAARSLGCDRTVFRRFPHLMEEFREGKQPGRNHRVEAVRELPGEHDVYCLTVPEAGNFALQAGVFPLNCGIIVNVTPFEPEWEGHVTLEISNTTPLPAKIYANEGIAQVIFFESDEPCTISYADRGGKYQSQRGVTLPRL